MGHICKQRKQNTVCYAYMVCLWKTTKMENDEMEDDQNGRQPNRKRPKLQNERCSKLNMLPTSHVLVVSEFIGLHC